MNVYSGEFKARSLACVFLVVLVLTACSSSAPASQSSGSNPEPASQLLTTGHPPVITRVVERVEVVDGFQYTYIDIYFTDPDGDAVAVTYQQVSTSMSYPIPLTDDPIETSVEEQTGEALFTTGGRCRCRLELVIEIRMQDRAGNLSEPATARLSCTTPPIVDVQSILISGLGIAAIIALLLALGFWLLFRKQPGERRPALRSMLLLACLILLLNFAGSILHEGGHALYVALHGVPILLYVHPFTFPGYARPMIDNSTWINIAGSLTALPLSLLISLPFWKRRSTSLLPLLLLFPVCAIYNGLNVLGLGGSDFRNPVQYNGVSPIPFPILGTLIVAAGILFLFALLPLFGLDPKDEKSLFVLPAAVFIASTLSLLVACLLVPGSPIDREYFLGQEIVSAASMLLIAHTGIWTILAVLYVTFYRSVYPRLPTLLRTETVKLDWKDLRLPALLAIISVILGLIIIT